MNLAILLMNVYVVSAVVNKLQHADNFFARLLLISFFVPPAQTYMAAAACGYFLFRSLRDAENRKRIPARMIWAVVLGSGYLLFLLSLLYTPAAYSSIVHTKLERRAVQLLLPVITACFSGSVLETINGQLKFFSYACLVSGIYGNAGYWWLSHHATTDVYASGLSHVGYRTLFEQLTGLHPTYMAMYQCFSICILLYLPHSNNNTVKIFHWLTILVLTVCCISLFAKSPLFALLVILVLFAWQNRKYILKFWWAAGAFAAVIAATYVFVPFVSQRLHEVPQMFAHDRDAKFDNNSMLTRKLIWETDVSLVQQYWLTGVGPGRLQAVLDMKYFFFTIANGVYPGYFDPHNEYFWQWLSFGVVGIAVLVGVLGCHVLKAVQHKNILYGGLLLVLMITFTTESVMARQQGIFFYTIFTSFFFFLPMRQEEEARL
jgi:O-antigen ligase